MNSLSTLLISLVTTDVRSIAIRARRLAILYGMAGMLAFSAFAALLVSGGFYLARRMPPETAALVIAGVLLALSLVLVAAAMIWSSRQRRSQTTRSFGTAIAATAAIAMLPTLFSNRWAFGIVSAAIAGYALANRKTAPRKTAPHKSSTNIAPAPQNAE